jgi:hypothetical protein
LAAYDSDPLDDYLRETYDIELIAPHKCNRKRLTQDGRPFRRYRQTLVRGTTLCLAALVSSAGDSLGVSR